MSIRNKFLFFKTKEGFEKRWKAGEVSPDSIVFVAKEQLIWTHNQYFGIQTGFEKAKGYFNTINDLIRQHPSPKVGDWAILGTAIYGGETVHMAIAQCNRDGVWDVTGLQYDRETFDADLYIKKGDIDFSKYLQESDLYDYLKKGDINLSLYATKLELWEAILDAQRSSRTIVDSKLSTTSTNPVENRVIRAELNKKLEQSDLEDYAKTADVRNAVNDRIQEILDALENDEDYSILRDLLEEKTQYLQGLIDEINEKYISWGTDEGSGEGSGGSDSHSTSSNMVTLSEEAYQTLVETGGVDPNTYYFTYNAEDYAEGWTFGDKFPITFTQTWAFGGAFPITLL